MYAFLNIFFFVFHSLFILFIVTGWMWKKTRKANLVAILTTAFSWFILGIWFGFGYCPCTDWHWQVRMKLGIFDTHTSYVGFLLEKCIGLRVERHVADVFAVGMLVLSFIGSLSTNWRDWKKTRLARAKSDSSD